MEFTLDVRAIEEAVDGAIEAGALVYVDGIISITPRDLRRPPKDLNQKVSGDLKISINNKRIGLGKQVVGVRGTGSQADDAIKRSQGFEGTPVEVYAYYQEYGTIRIPPRSFIRRGLYQFRAEATQEMERAFRTLLRR